MSTPNQQLQRIADHHKQEHQRGLMDRYDDVADAHRDLVQSLRDVYGEQGPPQPLLKNLKGPREGRRDEVSRMDIPAMRKAVEAYEHWYSTREALATRKPHPARPFPLGVHMPQGDTVQRSLGKRGSADGLRREVLVTPGDSGRHGHAAYTTARRARMWGI